MTIIDPIADMFSRMHNSILNRTESVNIPYSKMLLEIAKILKAEGFIRSFDIDDEISYKKILKVNLKYDGSGKSVIAYMKKISTSGRRVYAKKMKIAKVQNGFGINILSTSKGVMTGKSARLNNVGGELLALVY